MNPVNNYVTQLNIDVITHYHVTLRNAVIGCNTFAS